MTNLNAAGILHLSRQGYQQQEWKKMASGVVRQLLSTRTATAVLLCDDLGLKHRNLCIINRQNMYGYLKEPGEPRQVQISLDKTTASALETALHRFGFLPDPSRQCDCCLPEDIIWIIDQMKQKVPVIRFVLIQTGKLNWKDSRKVGRVIRNVIEEGRRTCAVMTCGYGWHYESGGLLHIPAEGWSGRAEINCVRKCHSLLKTGNLQDLCRFSETEEIHSRGTTLRFLFLLWGILGNLKRQYSSFISRTDVNEQIETASGVWYELRNHIFRAAEYTHYQNTYSREIRAVWEQFVENSRILSVQELEKLNLQLPAEKNGVIISLYYRHQYTGCSYHPPGECNLADGIRECTLDLARHYEDDMDWQIDRNQIHFKAFEIRKRSAVQDSFDVFKDLPMNLFIEAEPEVYRHCVSRGREYEVIERL